jgi:hypothetical protein
VAVVGVVLIVVLVVLGGDRLSADRAIAHAINLRPSDLPGFVVEPPDHSGAGRQVDSRMTACVGSGWVAQHRGGHLVDVASPQFASGSGLASVQVGSDVTIVSSTNVVRRDLATINSGRIQNCLASALNGLAITTQNGPVVTIDSTQVTPIAMPAGASDGSFGIRTTMTMSALGRSVPVIFDTLGYAVGRDEIGLTAFGIGNPFPAQSEQQLAALLISRALSHPH